uniref:Uncharacterized protein n=1 Tax=Chrysolophus pictus TaxID=9089 RepID=A0A8C3LV23_CHRPC
MSFVPREAGRGRGGRPVGWHQHRGRPLGVAMEAAAGDGDPMESVVDPDMVALFDEFLGKAEEFSTPVLVPAGAQPYHYVVRDTEHKGLYLRDGRLVAANLQGANADQEGECWEAGVSPAPIGAPHPPRLPAEPISVVPNRHLERQRCPLLVGIRGGTKALSCGTGPEPRLQLEVSVGGSVRGELELQVGATRGGGDVGGGQH